MLNPHLNVYFKQIMVYVLQYEYFIGNIAISNHW